MGIREFLGEPAAWRSTKLVVATDAVDVFLPNNLLLRLADLETGDFETDNSFFRDEDIKSSCVAAAAAGPSLRMVAVIVHYPHG